jgi:poly(3-hydroxybutyrate) depolymerase
MTLTDFDTRDGRTVARLVEVAQLGHAWSGGAAAAHSDPRGPDASRLAWAFAAVQFSAAAPPARTR